MTTEQKIAAWKASRPAKGWRVFYKRDVFDVIARDEAQIHAELSTVLYDYEPRFARITANER